MKETRTREVLHRPLVNLWETALGTSQGFYLLLKDRKQRVGCRDNNVLYKADRQG